MSSYLGRHAELYDLFYSDKPYAQEAGFIHETLCEHGHGKVTRLLELACGTGNHAFEFEKLGYEVLGTDYSVDMLACARRKAEARSSKVQFRQIDMRQLENVEGTFDAIVCLFDSIGYVQSNQAVQVVFSAVKNKLSPHGLFIFEFWHAAAMLRFYEPLRVRRWEGESGTILRISETRLDCLNQVGHVHYSVYELRKDDTYSFFTETQTNRFFQVQEMALLLASCGLEPIAWFNGFTSDKNIDENTWHVVAVARKG
jgi:SAM-dependent methyltransferase